jgi:hypothetical protein
VCISKSDNLSCFSKHVKYLTDVTTIFNEINITLTVFKFINSINIRVRSKARIEVPRMYLILLMIVRVRML